MSGSSPRSKARLLLIPLVLAAAAALTPSAPLALAIDVRGGRDGHAMFRIGFASVRIVFGSEQRCPNSDSCAAPKSAGVSAARLARSLLNL